MKEHHWEPIAPTTLARWDEKIALIKRTKADGPDSTLLVAIDRELTRLQAIAQAAQEYVYRENVCRLAFEGRATADTLVQCQVKMRQASEALAHATLLGPDL